MLYQRLLAHYKDTPQTNAYISSDGSLTYAQLIEYSAKLAHALHQLPPGPIVVFGHKQIWMPVAFFACFFSGHPYVPINSDTPAARVNSILSISGACTALAVEDVQASLPCFSLSKIQSICTSASAPFYFPQQIDADTPFYVLFTSGSTGVPKGIPISYGNLTAFLSQMQSWLSPYHKEIITVINTALFSFDLSVADLFYTFYNGKTLFALEKDVQKEFFHLFARLAQSKAQLMVLTPTFASYCLLDRSFSQKILPHLKVLFFCGETLSSATVQKLWRRFPGLHIFNAYGPTEATVAVCAAEIQPSFLSSSLPVGHVHHDIQLSGSSAAESQIEEIILTGPQLSGGYLSSVVGGFCNLNKTPAFKTGDLGRIYNGLLYFHGRKDRQIKRGGHRIEPAEIETALNTLADISQSAVLLFKNHLCAVVIPKQTNAAISAVQVRGQLAKFLPAYMLPDRFFTLSSLPFTPNGKLDYSFLESYLEEQMYGGC